MVHSIRRRSLLALAPVLLVGALGVRAQDDSKPPDASQSSNAAQTQAASSQQEDGQAQTDAPRADDLDRTPRECLQLRNIRETHVIDDQTILFYMRGGNKPVYRNHLPQKCPNLDHENRFGYEARNSQLCDVDLITVLEQFGTRLTPGFTCRLGEFYPVTFDEAELMRVEHDHPDKPRGAITSKPAALAPAAAASKTEPVEQPAAVPPATDAAGDAPAPPH